MAAFEAMEGGGAGARAAGPLLFAAAGIGTLIKGPVSLILPLLVAAAWALVRRRPALLLRLRPRIGLAIYAAFVLPWLGYSTWHLYTRLVDRKAIASRCD